MAAAGTSSPIPRDMSIMWGVEGTLIRLNRDRRLGKDFEPVIASTPRSLSSKCNSSVRVLPARRCMNNLLDVQIFAGMPIVPDRMRSGPPLTITSS